eukprot:CAMPEP_0114275740 /NCGR_PEP_ID=MMETSP0058-20121206/30494_1 /TAXON_ID=36894 /ORGANISM="Pyramimonas parkeae, CCMP726" /LENGTH=117 /DNA_ID=CAMNT_0001395687 /DNA_START=45 /DNA_END=395 /DNA_ORIENTATION=+
MGGTVGSYGCRALAGGVRSKTSPEDVGPGASADAQEGCGIHGVEERAALRQQQTTRSVHHLLIRSSISQDLTNVQRPDSVVSVAAARAKAEGGCFPTHNTTRCPAGSAPSVDPVFAR